jgi:hypothetical protein
MITRLLLTPLLALVLFAGCISQPRNCSTSGESRPDNSITGQQGGTVIIVTLCSDKDSYKLGETVHLTMSVKNALNEPIVLGDGQSPVLDIVVHDGGRRSDYQPPAPTRLDLKPWQTYVLTWDWPPPDVNVNNAKGFYGWLTIEGYWIGLDGGKGHLGTSASYGPTIGLP